MIQVDTLDDSTRLIMETVDNTETVSVGFWFLNGSRDEAEDQHGFTHILEHMLFKGTPRRNAFQIAREIDCVGGSINAFTDKENSCYYCTVPGQDLLLALDVLLDMLFQSSLDAHELEKEKIVVLNEIASALDTPEDLAHELFFQQLWPGHPLSAIITGEMSEVKKITLKKLQAFYRDFYTHSPLIISIAGKFKMAEARDFIQGRLEPRLRQSRPRLAPQPIYGVEFLKNRFIQVQIYAGTQLPALRSLEDYYRLLILSTIIGESLSARLFQRIREELGLCYSITSFRTLYSDTALWMIYANTSAEYVPELLKTLNTELHALRTEHVSSREVRDAKNHLKGQMLLSREDMETRMKRLARLELLIGKQIDFESSLNYIDSISLEEINEYLKSIFRSDQFRMLTLGTNKINRWKGFQFTF